MKCMHNITLDNHELILTAINSMVKGNHEIITNKTGLQLVSRPVEPIHFNKPTLEGRGVAHWLVHCLSYSRVHSPSLGMVGWSIILSLDGLGRVWWKEQKFWMPTIYCQWKKSEACQPNFGESGSNSRIVFENHKIVLTQTTNTSMVQSYMNTIYHAYTIVRIESSPLVRMSVNNGHYWPEINLPNTKREL